MTVTSQSEGARSAAPPVQALRLVTVEIPAEGMQARAFLLQGRGVARGFWARGEDWVAHRGVAVSVDAAPGSSDADRFHDVRSAAVAVAPVSSPDGAAGHARAAPRFYGGFSFREGHASGDVWEAFPSALFHLPEWELVGGRDGGVRLRGWALAAPGRESEVEARLADDLVVLRGEVVSFVDAADPVRAEGRGIETDRGAWEAAVSETLDAIHAGRISKAVLARTLDVSITTGVDPVRVAMALWDANRGTHVFLFEPEAGHAILGAAPETVATIEAGMFHATAVAGSIRRGDDDEEQRRLADRLLSSEKDRSEQRIALDDMVARLTPVCGAVEVAPEPHVLTLARIQHLETHIRAPVTPGTDVLAVLSLLHPTPAVCGLPRDEALLFLAEEEPFRRGWYAGPVGWFDTEGNGVFAPALRMGVMQGERWRLFAGAGIVEGSVPYLEWEETRIKFEPVLRALAAVGVDVTMEASLPPGDGGS
ncbi:MAG: isochorismate synthase [Gemmatimonadota bacterium]|nr:isochorismate synthase [Gemmatimonadota bacterium]MDH5760121.1 isochorismate synthase [Gemmatimonadota bacterium]